MHQRVHRRCLRQVLVAALSVSDGQEVVDRDRVAVAEVAVGVPAGLEGRVGFRASPSALSEEVAERCPPTHERVRMAFEVPRAQEQRMRVDTTGCSGIEVVPDRVGVSVGLQILVPRGIEQRRSAQQVGLMNPGDPLFAPGSALQLPAGGRIA